MAVKEFMRPTSEERVQLECMFTPRHLASKLCGWHAIWGTDNATNIDFTSPVYGGIFEVLEPPPIP